MELNVSQGSFHLLSLVLEVKRCKRQKIEWIISRYILLSGRARFSDIRINLLNEMNAQISSGFQVY